jgi:hypothetical protein
MLFATPELMRILLGCLGLSWVGVGVGDGTALCIPDAQSKPESRSTAIKPAFFMGKKIHQNSPQPQQFIFQRNDLQLVRTEREPQRGGTKR